MNSINRKQSSDTAQKFRWAFAGLRHPHIYSLYDRILQHAECAVVGAWEQDSDTRQEIATSGKVDLTHETFEALLEESGCNIVAIGDTYGRRGQLVIAALEAGCHVMADKPLCTSLEELKTIEALAKAKNLSVGCQLDLTEHPVVRGLYDIVQRGQLGDVQTVTILAQHPLLYGSRANWYFEPGSHGGTINDIGVHVFDLLPWLVNATWKTILSARDWNAKAVACKHFKDCAQVHGLLENGVSCFADLSYLAPDQIGYTLAQYWRITVHGTKGMAEASYGDETLHLTTDSDTTQQSLNCSESSAGQRDYLQNFLDEMTGKASSPVNMLTTENILHTSRLALEAQKTADSIRS